jgi:hypothetical protein
MGLKAYVLYNIPLGYTTSHYDFLASFMFQKKQHNYILP